MQYINIIGRKSRKQMSAIGTGMMSSDSYNTNMESLKNYVENNWEDYSTTDENVTVVYEKSTGVMQIYGLYSIQNASSKIFKSNRDIQSALSGLGFYVGPPDGSLTTKKMKKAIKNFQQVYGIKITGKMNTTTQKKLKKATTMRKKCIMDSKFKKMSKKLYFDTEQQSDFINTWTFLRVGMGLSKKQTAGVCGNILEESRFSSDNRQDTDDDAKVHDTEYKYKVDDQKGYGLLQWTYISRKQGLQDMAKNMTLKVSNINAQLAQFRDEVINGEFKNIS